jgi:CBS domain-containing protein
MRVKDIMTKNVAYVNPESVITDAARLMQQYNVGSIPVCDQTGVVGMVTDRDIVVRNVAHGTNPSSTKVRDVMTANVTIVTPEMGIEEVSNMMAKNQIRRVPVVENSKLVGMLSLGDLATEPMYNMEAGSALSEISKPVK